tara:strand:+ start:331 stop:699 length:369 start_codon:yes stop_codon:yes gene_type:complete
MIYFFNWLLIFIVSSIVFTQESCDGHCLSDDQLNAIMNDVKRLEFDLEKQVKISENLDSQIYMYIQSDSLYQSQIKDYKKQLELSAEMIKLVKPKWYENKYLWFFGGILITSGSVYLAGQIK